MINPLIISRLIEADYDVFIPINGNRAFVFTDKNCQLVKCIALNASKDGEGTPFVKIDGINNYIACCDKETRTVWLIPSDCYKAKKNLRLGINYEEYIIPEPKSLSYLEQKKLRKSLGSELLEKAKEVAERLCQNVDMTDDLSQTSPTDIIFKEK